jgi:multiple sugar transport system substrate-binding protein/sn-glycerol 3-phosphate transport system substrate-binding protein
MNKQYGIVLAVLVLALALVVPGFAQDDPYADVDPSNQTVIFWHQHSGAREEELLEIVEQFNATNEWNITVEASNQGGYGDIFQKMNLGLTAGGEDLPELVVAYGNQSASYQLADGLVDMSTLVDSPTWGLSEEEKADFFTGFYNADIIGGERLGFPPNRSMEVMYYNSDWLAELSEAGVISFEGAPTTPEQFREAACAAVENPYSGATGDPAQSLGYQLSVDASRFASWTFAFGGDVFDTEANQYTYNSEAAVEAMTFLQGLFADGCAGPVVERFGDQANFGQGITLFTVGSSSGLPFYRSAVDEGAAFNWSVAAIPHTTEEPVQNIYGASVSIPRSTPEQELAAWLFMKYYTSPEIQADWAVASNYFPVRASVADGLAEYFDQNEAYATAFELLQYGTVEPQVAGYDFVRDMIEQTMAAIVDDPSLDVQATLDAANEEANEILADQMAM